MCEIVTDTTEKKKNEHNKINLRRFYKWVEMLRLTEKKIKEWEGEFQVKAIKLSRQKRSWQRQAGKAGGAARSAGSTTGEEVDEEMSSPPTTEQ